MAAKNNGMDFFAKNRVADPDLQEEGVWVTDAYNGQLDIKVRRTKSKHAQDVRKKLYKPYQNMRTIPEKKQDELNKRWVAEGLLVDWRAAEGADGTPPACTTENALAAFEADPDLLDEVVYFAAEAETFRADRIEEDAGNSQPASDGS
jgi:hypothetical protein